MEDFTVRRGEIFDFGVVADDLSAVSVQFIASKNNVVYVDETETFNDDGEATIRIDTNDLPLGDYLYSLTITYSDGTVDILPDPEDCDGDCDLPVFTVCTSNDDSLVS